MIALQPDFNQAFQYMMPPAVEAHWSDKQQQSLSASQHRGTPPQSQSDSWLQAPPAQSRRASPAAATRAAAEPDQLRESAKASSPAPRQGQEEPADSVQSAMRRQQQQQQNGATLAHPARPDLERRGSSPGLRYVAEELTRELNAFDPWSPLPAAERRVSQGSLEQQQQQQTRPQQAQQEQEPSPTNSNFEPGLPPAVASHIAGPPSSSAPLFISPFLAAQHPVAAPADGHTSSPDAATAAAPAATQRPTALDVNLANRRVATLHLGDLDYWMMDEMYISRCVSLMGWDIANPGRGSPNRVPVSIKMIHGSSNSTSGYCFLRFPTQEHAASVMDRYQATQLRTLMPGSERTFKLNWATGMPGAAPQWENEFSIFVGDLSREVTESELVSLFAPLFPSCQSAKVMYDSSTGHSKGYGFVRFSEEADRSRALALGKSGSGAGLTLRGRTLRISEASSPSSATASTFRSRHTSDASSLYSMRTVPSYDSLFMPDERQRAGSIASSFGPPSAGSHQTTFSGLPDAAARLPPSPTVPFTSDPGNTTVFVGGLPAAITEGELHAMFQDFGPIAYVKIPNSLGCGFVQFANRSDAEMAIVKMQNFPVNANARIRLAWGRSATDKHLEQVKKLSVALGMPFDNVLKMVESQDRGTVRNITSAVAHQAPEPHQALAPRAFDGRGQDMGAMGPRPSLDRFPHRSTMPAFRSRPSAPSVEHLSHRRSFDSGPYDATAPTSMGFPSDFRSAPQQPQHPQQQQAHSFMPPSFAQGQPRMNALSREDLQRQFMSAAQGDYPAAAAAAAAAAAMPPQRQRQMQEERLGVSFADLFSDMNLSSEPVSYT